jgi:membrane associated rhomboid family serine protease
VYLAGSVYAMRQSQAQGALGGIAHEAHLGGALGGLLLTVLLEPAVLSRFLGYFGL